MIQNLGVHCSYMWSTFMVVIRSSQLDVFTVPYIYTCFFQFLDYIYSKTNSIFNEEYGKIYQDMTRPLSQYWIASSHNT